VPREQRDSRPLPHAQAPLLQQRCVAPTTADACSSAPCPQYSTPSSLARGQPIAWRYQGSDGAAIGIRASPELEGPWTGSTLVPGEVFHVSQEYLGQDGILYLRLADGRGWAFDRKPGEGTLCTRLEGSEAGMPGHQRQQLQQQGGIPPERRRLSAERVIASQHEAEVVGAVAATVDAVAVVPQLLEAPQSRQEGFGPGPQASEAGQSPAYSVGEAVQVLRSDRTFSPGTVRAVQLTERGPFYEIVVPGGGTKKGVPECELRPCALPEPSQRPGPAPAPSSPAPCPRTARGPGPEVRLQGTASAEAAALPADPVAEAPAAGGCGWGMREAAGPLAAVALAPAAAAAPVAAAATSLVAPTAATPSGCVRIYIGTVEFQGFAGMSLTGMFETAGFRVVVQLGSQADKRWQEDCPMTQKQALRYSREVSSEGRYTSRISCEFDEAFDLPWPTSDPPEQVTADVWLERRTVVEQLDSILDSFGLGNNLPPVDRTWVGRAVASLPAEGEDAMPQHWPVMSGGPQDGPLPKSLSVGVEWVAAEAGNVFDDPWAA